MLEDRLRAVEEQASRDRERAEADAARLSEITGALAASLDLDRVVGLIVDGALELTAAGVAALFRYDETREGLTIFRWRVRDAARAEEYARMAGQIVVRPGEGVAGRAFQERRPLWNGNPAEDAIGTYGDEETQRLVREEARAVLGVPIVSGGGVYGVLTVAFERPHDFTPAEIRLVTTLADHAAIAIQNARLSERSETRARDLARALERETATSEILRAISSSPTELAPVFETILASAVRLCGAVGGAVLRFDGAVLDVAAHSHVSPEVAEWYRRRFPRPIGDDTPASRAILTRSVVHIADTDQNPGEQRRGVAQAFGFRSLLVVPMLKGDTALGVIAVYRTAAGAFPESEIALLQRFADQAMIAIENVRLFTELQAKNRELTRALDQQTATAEILRVISSSPTDERPVFDTIVGRALRLTGGFSAAVFRVTGEELHLAAYTSTSESGDEALRAMFPRPAAGLTLEAIRRRAPVFASDVETDPRVVEAGRALARARGFRAHLFVPMLREGDVLGIISVTRREAGPFTDDEIALLQTFADQAVIAIENVRLFRELEARNRDLTTALEQQTATAEILRVISSSPTDVQPVFDAIVANTARLCDVTDVNIRVVVGDELHRVAGSGSLVGAMAASGVLTPIPIDRDSVIGRAVLEGTPIHVHDLEAAADEFPRLRALRQRFPYRTFLAVPLLREGRAVGVIGVPRQEVRPFTDTQIALLQGFADQAVIAIENVRLFKELEARNRDLTESLERQTATSAILRVISSSPTDEQPVFDTIVGRALRLTGGFSAAVFRLVGDELHLAAYTSTSESGDQVSRAMFPRPADAVTLAAIRRRAPLVVGDVETDPRIDEAGRALARARGYGAYLDVPMLREDDVLGLISVTRRAAGPFTDDEIALLQTFADQAVIAIENVRLFTELGARNRDLTDSLARQTAMSEILSVISSSPTDTHPVFDAIAASAWRLCDASLSVVYRFDGDLIHVVAYRGLGPEAIEATRRFWPSRPHRGNAAARSIVDRAIVHIPDIPRDPEYVDQGYAQSASARSVLAVPMMRGGQPIGTIAVAQLVAGHFSDTQVALLQTFADQAVIAIENVRLFKELEARNGELTRALEQQTATGEILRAISTSTTDVHPVFDAIVRNAGRVCDATDALLVLREADQVRAAAHWGPINTLATGSGYPLNRGTAMGRAIVDARPIHVEDIATASDFPEGRELAARFGHRTTLAVPLLRVGGPVGSLLVRRTEVRPFSDKQIAMLQTFADQAVIAIENARLFNELQARTDDLTRSVERLTALGEVGQAVSSTLELETVLSTIVGRAVQLAGADAGSIYEYDEATEEFSLRVTQNFDEELVALQRAVRLRKGEGAMGRAANTRQPVQIPDIAAAGAYESRARELLLRSGTRALLAVPLLREGRILGSLVVGRRTPGEFPREIVGLLETFATQSALAIQNARLFGQLEEKSRELEVASRHKSEFLANMSHELRTPLNAIIGYSEMLEEEATDLGQDGMVADLRKVHGAGKHLLELINAVLDLSKIEAGKMELFLEEFEVQGLVDEIAAVIAPLAEKKGNRLEVRCGAGAGTMRADLTKVRQALFNLLSNACKFTEHGTVSLLVAPETREGNDGIAFTVQDTGIGMTAEQVGRLFQEFTQAETGTSRKYGGTGLGLALSRRLARLMGGDIDVASEPGRGSAFTIRLPRIVAEPRAETTRSADTGAPAASSDAAGPVVLVIDDDPAARDLMQRFLTKEGYRIALAPDGEEGVRLARDLRPDAITLDVMMPGMDGWAVLAALKSDPATVDIPVIMLTIVDDRNLGYALGATEYLTKPIDRERLLAVLARCRREAAVLVVDDDPAMREWLRRLLEGAGYVVEEAENGRIALDRLRAATPALILLDLMMPEMDGFEFLDEVRRHETWRAIPIVVVTARDLTADDHRRLNGGVERVLAKGAFTRDGLLREVGELVAASVGRRRGRPG